MIEQLSSLLSVVQERKSLFLAESDAYTALSMIERIIKQYPCDLSLVLQRVRALKEDAYECRCSSCITEEMVYEWYLLQQAWAKKEQSL